jgi:hypothetical protein
MSELILYHGSAVKVKNPDLEHTRIDLDFGAGFYLTEDKQMAEKWACNKNNSVLNTYVADLSGLKVCKLDLTTEWLHFVIENRNDYEIELDYEQYDVIIGPVADDKMYRTISDYEAGYISSEEAIKLLDTGGFSNQYCFRTEKALKKLDFLHSRKIVEPEKTKIIEEARKDREKMEQLVQELKKDKVPQFKQRGRKR